MLIIIKLYLHHDVPCNIIRNSMYLSTDTAIRFFRALAVAFAIAEETSLLFPNRYSYHSFLITGNNKSRERKSFSTFCNLCYTPYTTTASINSFSLVSAIVSIPINLNFNPPSLNPSAKPLLFHEIR